MSEMDVSARKTLIKDAHISKLKFKMDFAMTDRSQSIREMTRHYFKMYRQTDTHTHLNDLFLLMTGISQ